MQHIENFDKCKHLDITNGWLEARNLKPVDDVPELGFIAFERGEPIACAFIRRVEGGYAQLDGLTTNPDFPGDQRSTAIDSIVEHLMNKAKQLGIKSIYAHSVDLHTLLRSSKHGFEVTPQVLIVADLTQKA
jgi:N-acetylglutamate synthase-like GNAT family acetyltransferase